MSLEITLGFKQMPEYDFGLSKIKEEPMDSSYGAGKTLLLTDLDGQMQVKQEPVGVPLRNDAPVDQNIFSRSEEVKPRRTTRKSNNILVSRNANDLLVRKARKNIVKQIHTLDDIASMNGKQLVQNFSELSFNEMTKYFAYTCCLMPDVCSNFFTSFGSENDARNKMQKHITQHVKDLVASKQRDKSFSFTAEAVVSRATVEVSTKKRVRPQQPSTGPPNKVSRYVESFSDIPNSTEAADVPHADAVFTGAPYINIHVSPLETPDDDQPLDLRTTFRSQECGEIIYFQEEEMLDIGYSVEVDSQQIESGKDESCYLSDEESALVIQEDEENADATWSFRSKKIGSFDDDEEEWTFQKKPAKRNREGKELVKSTNESSSNSPDVLSSDRNSYDIDDITFDLKNVWLLDHNYDARHHNQTGGESQAIEDMDDQLSHHEKPHPGFDRGATDRIDDGNLPTLHFSCPSDENEIPSKLIIPIVRVPLPNLPNLIQLLNEPFPEDSSDIEEPPAKRHKGFNIKTEHSNSTEDEDEQHHPNQTAEPIRLASEEEVKEIEAMRGRWTKEHEKILAKYYLKEHEENKGKNKRQGGPWVCKICPDKQFTAGTTLSYHYKSHTGEKSYQCSDCFKTFTRKHSLDYHTMTHTQTNRFKCPFCDRQFRHTSHYKNHVEQHKGEETFHCDVCSMTFKSKTTFKRHMKSKHNAKLSPSNKVSRVMDLSTINELHLKSVTGNNSTNNEEAENVTENVSIDANTNGISDASDSQSETLNGQADIDHPTGNPMDHGLNFTVKTEPLDDPFFGALSDKVIVIQPLDEENPVPSIKPKYKPSISWRPLGKKSRRK